MERRRIVTDLSYLRAQAASGGTAATPSAIVCLIHCPSAPVEFVMYRYAAGSRVTSSFLIGCGRGRNESR
jgi:hypothetical protein